MNKDKFSRRHSNEDMDLKDKLHVKHILLKLGCSNIKFNQFLLTPKNIEDRRIRFQEKITKQDLQNWKLSARPDITAECNHVIKLIEIDGSVHRKDLDSKPFYDELQLKYVILNKEYLRLMGISWEKYLTEQLQSIT